MPNKISGLPAHVLLVHLVVVLIPVAAAAVLVSAWWPAARRRLGAATPILAVLALIVVPITTHAGQWLLDHLPSTTPAIDKHVNLGHGMLIWVIGLAILGVAVYVVGILSDRAAATVNADQRVPVTAGGPERADAAPGRSAQPGQRAGGSMFAVSLVVAVLATAVAVGSGIQIYRVGDSGAHAVWQGVGGS
jgi:hypothetical protein